MRNNKETCEEINSLRKMMQLTIEHCILQKYGLLYFKGWFWVSEEGPGKASEGEDSWTKTCRMSGKEKKGVSREQAWEEWFFPSIW